MSKIKLLLFSVSMSVSRNYPPSCHGNIVRFYTCNGVIGCTTYDIDFPNPPGFSTTYSDSGIYRRVNNDTICGNTKPKFLGCCQADIVVCNDSCPQEDLASGPFSYILITVRASTRPSDLTMRPSLISSSRSSVPSFTSISVSSSVSTGTVGKQTALQTVLSVPEATSTSVSPSASASPNAAAIAGGVAGGVAGLALLVGLLFVCRRRRKTKSQHGMSKGGLSAWNTGQPHFMPPSNTELHQIKQEPSTGKSLSLLHTIICMANGVF